MIHRILPFLPLLTLLVACDEAVVDVSEDADGDRYSADEDCNDDDRSAFPGASEVCDGVDNNCDGEVDEDVVEWQYTDADGDAYGDPNSPVASCGEAVEGAVFNNADCDDTNPAVNPQGDETLELCDDLDNDCDGAVDGGFRVPADFALPSHAVGAARDGDLVCVAPGTYVDNVDFGGDEVWLLGVGGSAVTTIQSAGDAGPVVSFDTREGEGARLSGFTITGGDDPVGAGIYIRAADPTIEDVVVTDNSCGHDGGSCWGTGIYAEDSEFTLTDSVVTGNTAMSSYTYYPYNYGAGIALVRSSPVIRDVVISENVIDFPAGAYYAAGFGAGLYVNGGDPDVANVTIVGNIGKKAGTSYIYGVGVYQYGTSGYYENVAILDNKSVGYGAYGAGLFAGEYSSAIFQNAVIANNTAGGEDSYVGAGGGVFFSYTWTWLENADIVGNSAVSATYGGGGGVYGYYYSAPVVTNSSIWGNSALVAGVEGGGAVMFDATTPASGITFTYSNVSENGVNPFQNTTSPEGLEGNIAGDPAYVDLSAESAADWDFTLGAGSDLRDAGDPDIEDPDGSRSDIGSRGGYGGDAW